MVKSNYLALQKILKPVQKSYLKALIFLDIWDLLKSEWDNRWSKFQSMKQ